MKDLLIKTGKFILDNFEYDAVGLNEEEDILSIGFQNNTKSSCMVWISKEEENTICVAFHEKSTKQEAFGLWFRVFEHLPLQVLVGKDYK